jgi:hypothetical protein
LLRRVNDLSLKKEDQVGQPDTNKSTYFNPDSKEKPAYEREQRPPVGPRKSCETCTHYDPRTHFCRLNPPVPMLFFDADGKQNVSSKFPVITCPDKDYCSFHEQRKDKIKFNF